MADCASHAWPRMAIVMPPLQAPRPVPPPPQVWLLLLPVKIFCCPVGLVLQLVYDVFEWLVKAPLRALLFASGKPWRPEAHGAQQDEGKAQQRW